MAAMRMAAFAQGRWHVVSGAGSDTRCVLRRVELTSRWNFRNRAAFTGLTAPRKNGRLAHDGRRSLFTSAVMPMTRVVESGGVVRKPLT